MEKFVFKHVSNRFQTRPAQPSPGQASPGQLRLGLGRRGWGCARSGLDGCRGSGWGGGVGAALGARLDLPSLPGLGRRRSSPFSARFLGRLLSGFGGIAFFGTFVSSPFAPPSRFFHVFCNSLNHVFKHVLDGLNFKGCSWT